jgi:hypothetical protein
VLPAIGFDEQPFGHRIESGEVGIEEDRPQTLAGRGTAGLARLDHAPAPLPQPRGGQSELRGLPATLHAFEGHERHSDRKNIGAHRPAAGRASPLQRLTCTFPE